MSHGSVSVFEGSYPSAPPNALLRLAQAFFLVICGEAVLSIPYLAVVSTTASAKKATVAMIIVGLLVLAAYSRGRSILQWVASRLGSVPKNKMQWLWSWFAVGLVSRIVWAIACPKVLYADGETYFTRGTLLVTTHSYEGAFWPPGFPLFLYSFLAVVGTRVWVTELAAILLFAGTFWMTYLLARELAGGWTALLAPALAAIWPAYVTLVNTNSKEALLAFLLTTSLYCYVRSTRAAGWGFLILAGLLLGFATLSQPAYMLFSSVIFVADVVRRTFSLRALLGAACRTVLFSIAMIAVILPWTYRNYRVFHREVLITTSGGSVFYRANNPRATGGYQKTAEQQLPSDEFEASTEGYRLAKLWIWQHPGAFARLAFKKQTLYYLADEDVIGIHNVWKSDSKQPSRLYAPARLVCNGFWLGCWVVLLLGFPASFCAREWGIWYGVCFVPLVYQWMIDSIFESGSRHHTPYILVLCVLMALTLDPGLRGTGSGRPSRMSLFRLKSMKKCGMAVPDSVLPLSSEMMVTVSTRIDQGKKQTAVWPHRDSLIP